MIAILCQSVLHRTCLCCSDSCRNYKRFWFLLNLLVSLSVSQMTASLDFPDLLGHIHVSRIILHSLLITRIYHFIVAKILQLILISHLLIFPLHSFSLFTLRLLLFTCKHPLFYIFLHLLLIEILTFRTQP